MSIITKAFKERLDCAKIRVISIKGEPTRGMSMGSIRILEQLNKGVLK